MYNINWSLDYKTQNTITKEISMIIFYYLFIYYLGAIPCIEKILFKYMFKWPKVLSLTLITNFISNSFQRTSAAQ